MKTSRYIVNLETNETIVCKLGLEKVKGPIHRYYVIDPKVLYIKPVNTRLHGVLQVGKEYVFDPKREPYEYDTTYYYVYDNIRDCIKNEYNPEIFYLVNTNTIFKRKDGKLFCTSFRVLERVDINASNLFYKLKCPVDVMFQLATKFKNLWNEIISYLLLTKPNEINPDVYLNYCLVEYNSDTIDFLYSFPDNKLPSYLEPLRNMPITAPDNITRRSNFIKRILNQYKQTHPCKLYDFGDFLLDFLEKHNLDPSFARDWIVGDEDRVLQWSKKLKDVEIRNHKINKYFINPFTWANEIGNVDEMIDRLIENPIPVSCDSTSIIEVKGLLTHENFNQIHCWLKYIGPNNRLIQKLFDTTSPMLPEDALKFAVDIGYIDQCRELVTREITPREYKTYYQLEEDPFYYPLINAKSMLDVDSFLSRLAIDNILDHVNDIEYILNVKCHDYKSILAFASQVDNIRLSSNTSRQSLYNFYKNIITKIKETPDITEFFKQDYISLEQVFYTWEREFEDKSFSFTNLIQGRSCDPDKVRLAVQIMIKSDSPNDKTIYRDEFGNQVRIQLFDTTSVAKGFDFAYYINNNPVKYGNFHPDEYEIDKLNFAMSRGPIRFDGTTWVPITLDLSSFRTHNSYLYNMSVKYRQLMTSFRNFLLNLGIQTFTVDADYALILMNHFADKIRITSNDNTDIFQEYYC